MWEKIRTVPGEVREWFAAHRWELWALAAGLAVGLAVGALVG